MRPLALMDGRKEKPAATLGELPAPLETPLMSWLLPVDGSYRKMLSPEPVCPGTTFVANDSKTMELPSGVRSAYSAASLGVVSGEEKLWLTRVVVPVVVSFRNRFS